MKKNILWLMGVTFAFKILGFFNRSIIASYYGASVFTDGFYLATGFIEGICSVSLAGVNVSVVNMYLREKSDHKHNNFEGASQYCTVYLFVMLIIGLVVFFFSYQISLVIAPNFSRREIIITYVKQTAIIFPFQGIIIVLGGILQAEGNFMPMKITGFTSSLLSIATIVLLNNQLHEKTLIVSFVLAYVVNAIYIYVLSRRFVRVKIHPKFLSSFFSVINLSFPLIISSAAHEVNLMIDRSIATNIQIGAATILSCATVLYLFAENIIIQNVVIVAFPSFSKDVAQGEMSKLRERVVSCLEMTAILVIPVTIVFLTHSNYIASLAYGRGEFDSSAVNATGEALRGYIIGLVFLCIRDILLRVIYAFEKMKVALWNTMITVIVNISLDFLLYEKYGVEGISIATSISNIVASLFLSFYCFKKYGVIVFNILTKRLVCISLFTICFFCICILLKVPELYGIIIYLVAYAVLLYKYKVFDNILPQIIRKEGRE